MWPVIQAGSISVSSWHLWNLMAIFVVLGVHFLELKRSPAVKPALLWRLQPAIILAGLLGAHWYFMAAAWRRPYSPWLDFFKVTSGTSIQGGVLGGVAALVLLLKLNDEPIAPYFDVFAPGMAAAQAVTRVGCFFAGCCYGRVTHLPWAVVFNDPRSSVPQGIPLHPAQLYESALALALAVFLHRRLGRPGEPPGRVWWLLIAGWALIRFCVQFLRADDDGHLFLGMAHSQYLALVLMGCAAFALSRLRPLALPSPVQSRA